MGLSEKHRNVSYQDALVIWIRNSLDRVQKVRREETRSRCEKRVDQYMFILGRILEGIVMALLRRLDGVIAMIRT